jgi:CubicO group peptidase (beta-lactamase class C family)
MTISPSSAKRDRDPAGWQGPVRTLRAGFRRAGRWTSFSVAKSFTSTLVGAAIQDGAIRSLEDKVSQYIPDLRGSAYDDVSIRQLLTMSSGVRWNEDYEDPNSDVARFNTAKPDPGVDATVSYMRKLPRAHPPGEVWHYNTGETNLIGVLVSSAVKKPLAQYLQEKVWQPAGMEAKATWLKGKTGHEIAGCCLQAATRDFARFGLFVLANGKAGDRQIVPTDWFAQATTKQKDIGHPGKGYGFQWWTYDDGSVAAQGIFGQGIFIDPKRKLVIASNADWTRASKGRSRRHAKPSTSRSRHGSTQGTEPQRLPGSGYQVHCKTIVRPRTAGDHAIAAPPLGLVQRPVCLPVKI